MNFEFSSFFISSLDREQKPKLMVMLTHIVTYVGVYKRMLGKYNTYNMYVFFYKFSIENCYFSSEIRYIQVFNKLDRESFLYGENKTTENCLLKRINGDYKKIRRPKLYEVLIKHLCDL